MFGRGPSRKVKKYGKRGKPIAIALSCLASLAIGGSFVQSLSASAVSVYNPATDPYSMAAVTRDLGVADWWNDGNTGAGIELVGIPFRIV